MGQALAVEKARQEQAEAVLKMARDAPTESLQQELALLELQGKIKQARAALGTDRVERLTGQLQAATLEAELTQLQAQQLRDPEKGEAVVRTHYATREDVLRLQLAMQQAELAQLAAARAGQE